MKKIYIGLSHIKFFVPFGILFFKIYLSQVIGNGNQIMVALNGEVVVNSC